MASSGSGWKVFTRITSYIGVPQGFILGPTVFLLYISDLSDDIICNIAINADDTALYSNCDQASDLWQRLELASERESDLRDTVDTVRSGLLVLMVRKLSWFRLTRLITVVLLM